MNSKAAGVAASVLFWQGGEVKSDRMGWARWRGEGLKGGHLWEVNASQLWNKIWEGREKEGQAYSHSHALNVKCSCRLLCLMMS